VLVSIHHNEQSFTGLPPFTALLHEIASEQSFGSTLDRAIVLDVSNLLLVYRLQPFWSSIANIVGYDKTKAVVR
jgi:hypothetical protein